MDQTNKKNYSDDKFRKQEKSLKDYKEIKIDKEIESTQPEYFYNDWEKRLRKSGYQS